MTKMPKDEDRQIGRAIQYVIKDVIAVRTSVGAHKFAFPSRQTTKGLRGQQTSNTKVCSAPGVFYR